jgi:hypothetical protein
MDGEENGGGDAGRRWWVGRPERRATRDGREAGKRDVDPRETRADRSPSAGKGGQSTGDEQRRCMLGSKCHSVLPKSGSHFQTQSNRTQTSRGVNCTQRRPIPCPYRSGTPIRRFLVVDCKICELKQRQFYCENCLKTQCVSNP